MVPLLVKDSGFPGDQGRQQGDGRDNGMEQLRGLASLLREGVWVLRSE